MPGRRRPAGYPEQMLWLAVRAFSGADEDALAEDAALGVAGADAAGLAVTAGLAVAAGAWDAAGTSLMNDLKIAASSGRVHSTFAVSPRHDLAAREGWNGEERDVLARDATQALAQVVQPVDS